MPQPVDLRGLDPPEPLVRILDAIGGPGRGPLVFLLSREPLPLYALLKGAGWRWSVSRDERGVTLVLTLDQETVKSPRAS